ncbi:hypothetical protein [Parafilimonas sp.]|uniref:hypothetical protein n=1 Tax=Parafilimonas sp. TaxID=1969739 RepID=UPI0039E5E619
MKKNLVYPLCAVVLFFSCSPTYKTSQTPDDVYYSPAKKIEVQDRYDTYTSASDDDYYLRMKARDYDKWSGLDDYSYWYDSRYYYNNWYSPYTSYLSLSLGYGLGWGSYYSYYPYYGYSSWYNPWYSWYSPYYTVVYYKNPDVYYKPVRNNTNFSGYANRSYNNNNYSMPLQNSSRSRAYNTGNANSSNNSYYYSNRSNSSNQYNNSTPVRTFNNSSSTSSGSGARTSGSGSRTRP